jgi:DNA-binding transcriptional LysR family regulator
LSVGDLSGQPLLVRESGSGTRELIWARLRRWKLEQNPTMEFGNTEALKRAAVHGGGIAWLPRICMLSELREGLLREVPLRELGIVRPLMVLSREGAPVQPVAEAFLHLLREDHTLTTP